MKQRVATEVSQKSALKKNGFHLFTTFAIQGRRTKMSGAA